VYIVDMVVLVILMVNTIFICFK